jgi:protein ImuB
MEGWDGDIPRPIRLFPYPEPVEVMAPLPDDPPMQFRWRGRLHRVRAAEGPERIGREWWREAPAPEAETDKEDGTMRDYYRVEDEAGGRYWIFREGLFTPGAPPPRWFLHGLFG